MLELFRDPLWQFVGAILALVGIVPFLFDRKRKAISYQILSDTPLMSVKEKTNDKLQVQIHGDIVHDARILVLKLTNTGKLPIAPGDFVTPIDFRFKGNEKIYDAEILKTQPSNIKPNLEVTPTEVLLKLVLLNRRDSITLRIITANLKDPPEVGGRITGVIKIGVTRGRRLLTGIVIAGIISSLIGISLSEFKRGIPYGTPLTVLGHLLIIFGMLRSRRFRNRVSNIFKNPS